MANLKLLARFDGLLKMAVDGDSFQKENSNVDYWIFLPEHGHQVRLGLFDGESDKLLSSYDLVSDEEMGLSKENQLPNESILKFYSLLKHSKKFDKKAFIEFLKNSGEPKIHENATEYVCTLQFLSINPKISVDLENSVKTINTGPQIV